MDEATETEDRAREHRLRRLAKAKGLALTNSRRVISLDYHVQ